MESPVPHGSGRRPSCPEGPEQHPLLVQVRSLPNRLAELDTPSLDLWLTSFVSPDDTTLCILTVTELLHRQLRSAREGQLSIQLVDLGSGSGLAAYAPAAQLGLPTHITCRFLGLDLDPMAESVALHNFSLLQASSTEVDDRFRSGEPEILSVDLEDSTWPAIVQDWLVPDRPFIVVANCPYVPHPAAMTRSSAVDGGFDGLRFYTPSFFDGLQVLGNPDLTLMCSTVCAVPRLLERLARHGYYIVRLNVCVQPFGRYISRVTQHVTADVPGAIFCTDELAKRLLGTTRPVHALMGFGLTHRPGPEDLTFSGEEIQRMLTEFQQEGLAGLVRHRARGLGLWRLTECELRSMEEFGDELSARPHRPKAGLSQ